MNVTALVDVNGDAVERYAYDPYGKVSIYDASWSSRSSSSYNNSILFAGYYRDGETQLYHVRFRFYHPHLGRWMQRDPLMYVDGMNLYEYVGSNPLMYFDPMGLGIFQKLKGLAKAFMDELKELAGDLAELKELKNEFDRRADAFNKFDRETNSIRLLGHLAIAGMNEGGMFMSSIDALLGTNDASDGIVLHFRRYSAKSKWRKRGNTILKKWVNKVLGGFRPPPYTPWTWEDYFKKQEAEEKRKERRMRRENPSWY